MQSVIIFNTLAFATDEGRSRRPRPKMIIILRMMMMMMVMMMSPHYPVLEAVGTERLAAFGGYQAW